MTSPRKPPPPILHLPRTRRRHGAGLLVSIAVHALAIALVASGVARDWARTPAPGPIAIALPALDGGGGGAGGANHEAYISPPRAEAPRPVRARPLERPPERPVPAPPAVVPPPQPTFTALPDTLPSVVIAPVDSAGVQGTGGDREPGNGPGTGGGTGGGTGTGSGRGTGPGPGGSSARGRPPEPRQLVIPPADFPNELRGRRIAVTFFVAPDGRVERIEVVPAIAHGGFARKFSEAMRNYRFRPASSAAGTPVSGSTTITVSF